MRAGKRCGHRPGFLSDAGQGSKNFGKSTATLAGFAGIMLWIRPLMAPPSVRFLLLVAAFALALGCKSQIGDECQISTDCSSAGDRLCDITAPGGYCTVYNCEPGTCPEEESVCVQFGSQRSTIAACEDYQSPSPYARAFCMASCESADDCRAGYECANVRASNAWGALLIDTDRGSRACLASQSTVPIPQDRSGNACQAEVPSGAAGSAGAGGSAVDAGAGEGGLGGAPSAGGDSSGGQGGSPSGSAD